MEEKEIIEEENKPSEKEPADGNFMKIILFFYQVEIKPYKISVFSEKNNKYFTIMTLF